MDQQEFEAALKELEIRLERLRSLYEQYFLGIERIEPGVARKDVDRRLWAIRKVKVHNTARRFRLQNIIQRYNTLQQYWQRICRQIENGTYVRHVARAERRFGSEPPEPIRTSIPPRDSSAPSRRTELLKRTEMDLGAMLAQEMDADDEMRAALDAAFVAIERRHVEPRKPEETVASGVEGAPRPPPANKPPRPKPGKLPPRAAAQDKPAGLVRGPEVRRKPVSNDLSEDRIKSLYSELVSAKRKLSADGDVDYRALAKSLRRTEADLKKAHTGRKIDFRVEVEGGKAKIKPVVD